MEGPNFGPSCGAASQPLKIFFPHCLLNAASGTCLGVIDRDNSSVCVLAIVHRLDRDRNLEDFVKYLLKHHGIEVLITGMFTNSALPSVEHALHSGEDSYIKFEQKHHNGIPECRVFQLPWQQESCATTKHCSPLFILFDETQVLKTHLAYPTPATSKNTNPSHSLSISTSELEVQESRSSNHCSPMNFVFSSVQHFSQAVSTCHDMSIPMSWVGSGVEGMGLGWILRWMSGLCLALPRCIASVAFSCVQAVRATRLCRSSTFKQVTTFPATGSQLTRKSEQFCNFMRSEETTGPESGKTKLNFISSGNFISSVVVDLLLGLVLLAWMYVEDAPSLLAEMISSWAEQTGIGLQELLQWLMGAPAGLKLNTALAHFLGNFFLYHVYLWIGYLSILLPVMTVLLWGIAGAGIMGLSVQLALASDLLALLTFHIYCFYVYAARIYSLQMSALLSLARLFQGKKWNVLRQRVDSCSYDVDQLFMGTLLFTMLLFMLPTTTLFYVVFTMLRLIVLAIQSALTLLRELIPSFPWFSLLLWLSKSDVLNGRLEFQVLTTLPWQPTSLSLQMQAISLSEALQTGSDRSLQIGTEKPSLPTLCKKLIRGELIYPWGGDRR